jgi:hypothetical protein
LPRNYKLNINITAEQSADASVYADKEIVINADGKSNELEVQE